MRLEVQIDESEPVIYVLNKPEIYVGSSGNSDIVINTLEVSRKHLKILVIDNKCFVIDQGSTNGSYMNEARLVPGRRTEFTTFESLRLGDRVYLTLLQPNQAGTLNNKNIDVVPTVRTATSRIDSDKTRIISLKELHAAKTKKLSKKRMEVANRKKAESKRVRAEKDALKRVLVLASMWIAIGFGINLVWQSLPDVVKKTYAPPAKYTKQIELDDDEFQNFRIHSSLLLKRDLINTYFDKLKCVTEAELFFCDNIVSLKEGKSGAIEVEDKIVLFISEDKWIQKAHDFMMKHAYSKVPPSMKKFDGFTVRKAAIILYLEELLSPLIGPEYPHRHIYLALYSQQSGITRIGAIDSSRFDQLLKYLGEEKPLLDADNGIMYVNELDKYIMYF